MTKATKATKATKGARKIVAAGRGRVIQHPSMRTEIIKLARKAKPHVVYIGAPTYESISGYDAQAKGFAECGCTVEHLKITELKNNAENRKSVRSSIEGADIIAVSGGNTLFAMKKVRQLGMDNMIRTAMKEGTVLTGGSAGAICWFDSGHSDSRDPTTLRNVKPK